MLYFSLWFENQDFHSDNKLESYARANADENFKEHSKGKECLLEIAWINSGVTQIQGTDIQ